MNDQSAFSRANFAGPSAPAGAAKILPWLRLAATGGVMIGAGMYVAQVALPAFLKPSVVMGQAAGDTVANEIERSAAAKIEIERRVADAVAQANAKASADTDTLIRLQTSTADSLAPMAQMSGVADVACLLGNVVAAFTAPTGQVTADWRGVHTNDTGADINHTAKAVAGVTCGIGSEIRSSIRATQLDVMREVATARGMPITNGAVQVAAAPATPAASAPMVNLALAPHHIWAPDMRNELHIYASHLPIEVLKVFVDGLDMRQGWPDAWYDRVSYYRDAQRS